jgi:hypothetical protein
VALSMQTLNVAQVDTDFGQKQRLLSPLE